jgi:hypothetical protein
MGDKVLVLLAIDGADGREAGVVVTGGRAAPLAMEEGKLQGIPCLMQFVHGLFSSH